MTHRTQLHLDDDQHRWLREQARRRGSIAQVVRDLIDDARRRTPITREDSLVRYLLDEPPGAGAQPTTVQDLDDDLYGR